MGIYKDNIRIRINQHSNNNNNNNNHVHMVLGTQHSIHNFNARHTFGATFRFLFLKGDTVRELERNVETGKLWVYSKNGFFFSLSLSIPVHFPLMPIEGDLCRFECDNSHRINIKQILIGIVTFLWVKDMEEIFIWINWFLWKKKNILTLVLNHHSPPTNVWCWFPI